MAQQGRAVLKNYYLTGSVPTEQEFADFIDSVLNFADDNYTATDNNYDDAAVAEVAKVANKADQSTTYTKTEVDAKDTIKTVGETVSTIQFWTGTQAEYDLLTPDANTIYLITDD